MGVLRIVLVAPRIAANVGSIARTAAALGAELHLVGPFGFRLTEKSLRRASVGYLEEIQPKIHRDFESFWQQFPGGQLVWATTSGEISHTELPYSQNLWVIFGNEEEGVPQEFWECRGQQEFVSCRIPTVAVRCLNLAVAVGVVGFEIRRQWECQMQKGVG